MTKAEYHLLELQKAVELALSGAKDPRVSYAARTGRAIAHLEGAQHSLRCYIQALDEEKGIEDETTVECLPIEDDPKMGTLG